MSVKQSLIEVIDLRIELLREQAEDNQKGYERFKDNEHLESLAQWYLGRSQAYSAAADGFSRSRSDILTLIDLLDKSL